MYYAQVALQSQQKMHMIAYHIFDMLAFDWRGFMT